MIFKDFPVLLEYTPVFSMIEEEDVPVEEDSILDPGSHEYLLFLVEVTVS